MRVTPQAEVLADTGDLGAEIACMAGRCRATNLDPRSFAGIMGAAMALHAPPWYERTDAFRTDTELISDLLDIDFELWRRQNAYIQLRSAIVRRRASAVVRHRMAADAGHYPDMGHWADIIADCDTALDVLRGLPRRLRAARAALMRAPGELGETYQAVYDLLRQGRVMPRDGHFLTGEEIPC